MRLRKRAAAAERERAGQESVGLVWSSADDSYAWNLTWSGKPVKAVSSGVILKKEEAG